MESIGLVAGGIVDVVKDEEDGVEDESNEGDALGDGGLEGCSADGDLLSDSVGVSEGVFRLGERGEGKQSWMRMNGDEVMRHAKAWF